MKDKNLEQLKKEYMDIPIPTELDYVVKKALTNGFVNSSPKGNKLSKASKIMASIAASVVLLIALINVNPAIAKTASEIPIVGSVVKVLTFREYKINEDSYNADIKVPAIDGLVNKHLESSLNEKYQNENKKLYDEFIVEMKDLKENGGGHLGVDSGYVVKTDNDRLLSIGRYVVNTVGSSSTVFKYDTIDKKKEVLITLPSLFKDDSYIDIISANIKKQMIEQHKVDNYKYYWVEGIEKELSMNLFKKIAQEQSFYINPEGKLVISFDKYEVAPGYMGVVEFVIPTEVISNVLVGNEYVK
ncbi:RsiV family protein [Desulfotomaculum defluvii]